MRRMIEVVSIAVLTLATLRGAAGDPPTAREVLDQAVATARAAEALRYEAAGEAAGVLAVHIPRMAGSVLLQRLPGSEWPRMRVDAVVTRPGAAAGARNELGFDGKVVTVADHERRAYSLHPMPQGANLLGQTLPVLLREFIMPAPYERETRAVTLELLAAETIEGVECDGIRAVYSEDGGEAQWYFGRQDHLPRRVKRIVTTGGGEASLTTTVKRIEVLPDTATVEFAVAEPAGFKLVGPSTLLPAGSPAPDWSLKDPGGNEFALKNLRGKVVVFDFWATWCGPCRMAMPGMQRLHDKYKGKPVAIFGINCRERQAGADPVGFMKKLNMTYPILLRGDTVAQQYRVSGIPAFYVVGPEGEVVMAWEGYSEAYEKQAEQLIDALLARLAKTAGPASQPAAVGAAGAR